MTFDEASSATISRLRELLEHALYGSLELGSGGTAVSAVADVLATASLGCGHTFCGA